MAPASADGGGASCVAAERPTAERLVPTESGEDEAAAAENDYTRLPALLDARLSELKVDAALRPTTIQLGPVWTRKSQKALLGAPTKEALAAGEQKDETQRAFDLLDALSRSGSLQIDCASLHVILAVTHCFDDSLINVVVEKNVNPIEKLEMSSLIVATTIHATPAEALLRADQLPRVAAYSAPMLLSSPEQPE